MPYPRPPFLSLPNYERSESRTTPAEKPQDDTRVGTQDKQQQAELADMTSFPLYFASIYAMQFHPGAGTRGHQPRSARECALIALDMLELEQEIKKCQ